MTQYIFIDPGKPLMFTEGELPEEPKLNMFDAYGKDREEKWAKPLAQHMEAIAALKAKAVECANPEEVWKIAWEQCEVRGGQLYPVKCNVEYYPRDIVNEAGDDSTETVVYLTPIMDKEPETP